MLSISLWAIGENKDLSKGFFIFQKILIFGSIVAMCFEDFYIWWKVLLILDAVLFNPIIQIHLEDRDSWMIFDITTIVFLLVSWIVLFRKIKVKNGTPSTR
jgi:FtsH-binding integral membrane protein